jgi:hypothetical protein
VAASDRLRRFINDRRSRQGVGADGRDPRGLHPSDHHATIVSSAGDDTIVTAVDALADNFQGDPMSSTSHELPLAQVRSLTALVREVRVAAETLPKEERDALNASRRSISESRWSAENQSGRALQRRRAT